MLRRRACCPSASQRLSCSAACRSAARSFATLGRQGPSPGDDVDGVALAVFGVELRPLQRTAVVAALRGDSFLLVSPTASGKSLCFQLPALLEPPHLSTVVVSPLLALMREQVQRLRQQGVHAIELRGGEAAPAAERHLGDAPPPRLIYTTPEWLVRNHATLAERGVSVGRLVVDEAHCLSEWGAASNFRSDYLGLGAVRTALASSAGLERLPVSCLTATAAPQVRQDILRHLSLPPLRRPAGAELHAATEMDQSPDRDEGAEATLLLEGPADRPNLALHVCRLGASEDARLAALIAQLSQGGGAAPPRAMVFCITRAEAEAVAEALGVLLDSDTARSDAVVDVFHGGLSEPRRRQAARRWSRGRTRVLVATPAVGLGLDAPDVSLVVHYTMPPSLASYWQQVGRAGRDGRAARCVLFHRDCDAARVRHCLQAEAPGLDSLPRSRAELLAVESFVKTGSCRRAVLFEHLGGTTLKHGCGNCDVCLGPSQPDPATSTTDNANELRENSREPGWVGRRRKAEARRERKEAARQRRRELAAELSK